jgi:hypothetical protein
VTCGRGALIWEFPDFGSCGRTGWGLQEHLEPGYQNLARHRLPVAGHTRRGDDANRVAPQRQLFGVTTTTGIFRLVLA